MTTSKHGTIISVGRDREKLDAIEQKAGHAVSVICDTSDILGIRRAAADAAGPAITACLRLPENIFQKGHGDEHDRSVGPTLEQLVTSSREEVARLVGILRESRCGAVVRGVDGSVLPVVPAEIANQVKLAEQVSVPIRDPRGPPLAFLEVFQREVVRSPQITRLLFAIADSAARAIAERCFRNCYRHHWIMAAQCANDPGKSMLLAVDRDYQVVGADHRAQQFLKCRGMNFAPPGVALSSFFRISQAELPGGRSFETIMKLCGHDNETPWYVLTTPPDPGAPSYFGYSDRALLHSRPRLETVAALGERATQERKLFGIPPRSLRRIKAYIDDGLESGLNIGDLAESLGYSLSHFFRLFRRSFGMPPHRYLMHRRISLAQELLTKTDLNLASVALQSGFADQSHLCRNFQRFVGMPPRAFRMQQR